jgi:hypothetical protein
MALHRHPLAARILAAVGATSAAAVATVSFASLGSSCCPPPDPPVDTGPRTATLEDACSVELPRSYYELVERCDNYAVSECPAFDDPLVGEPIFEPRSFTNQAIACGPLRPGVPAGTTATTTATSSTTSAGGGGGGGGGSGVGGAFGQTGGGGAATPDAGVPPTYITCCYGYVTDPTPSAQGCGRPLFIDGAAVRAPRVERSDWASERDRTHVASVSEARRLEIGRRWADDASAEHASIASFARFSLELLAVGAPPELVQGSNSAMRDEVVHARLCYGLASRYLDRAVGPGPMPLEGLSISTSLVAVAVQTVLEGCVGETVSAMLAERLLSSVTDPEARAALRVIARDEATHAELAFRFVAWAVADDAVRTALVALLPILAAEAEGLPMTVREGDDALEAYGQAGDGLRSRIRREALSSVVLPCLEAVLAQSRRATVSVEPPAGSERQPDQTQSARRGAGSLPRHRG